MNDVSRIKPPLSATEQSSHLGGIMTQCSLPKANFFSLFPSRRRSYYYFLLIILSLIVLIYYYRSQGPTLNPVNLEYHRARVQLRTFEERKPCKHIYGQVVLFVMYRQSSIDLGYYGVALESLRCYLKGTDYKLFLVDIDADERVKKACGHHQQLFFKKHCAAAEYLREGDWLLVLDADTGVVNPHHCIEEWIDDRVNVIFYERFFNWEIAAGNYLARNSQFSFDFLKKWADWEFHQPQNFNGADNGCLQILIMETVIPDAKQEIENCIAIWKNGTNYETYMAYVVCVKLGLGATRLWPEKIRIYRRAHGWVRDGFLTSDKWGPSDFMLHGWKRSNITEMGWYSPFTQNPNSTFCGKGDEGWNWRPEKRVTDEEIRKSLALHEHSAGVSYPKEAKIFPHLQYPDVGNCYPYCETGTDSLDFTK